MRDANRERDGNPVELKVRTRRGGVRRNVAESREYFLPKNIRRDICRKIFVVPAVVLAVAGA